MHWRLIQKRLHPISEESRRYMRDKWYWICFIMAHRMWRVLRLSAEFFMGWIGKSANFPKYDDSSWELLPFWTCSNKANTLLLKICSYKEFGMQVAHLKLLHLELEIFPGLWSVSIICGFNATDDDVVGTFVRLRINLPTFVMVTFLCPSFSEFIS